MSRDRGPDWQRKASQASSSAKSFTLTWCSPVCLNRKLAARGESVTIIVAPRPVAWSSRCAANPAAKLDVFLRDVADPLLGGVGMGGDYLRYARLLDDRAKLPVALAEMHARAVKLPPDPARRWVWLANFLALYAYQDL